MKSAIVIDNGTGFTKLGYAGNADPLFVFPTALAWPSTPSSNVLGGSGGGGGGNGGTGSLSSSMANLHLKKTSSGVLDDLDYFAGEEAIKVASTNKSYGVMYPVRFGVVENWDWMERYWSYCLYNCLGANPLEHPILLTEPPSNLAEN